MRKEYPRYKKYLTKYSRSLRQTQTKGEMILWGKLRRQEFLGLKFKRQKPIHEYIMDFFCREVKLIIEIDGHSHSEYKHKYDIRRQHYLENLGYKVLRFTEHEVVNSLENVLQTIELEVNPLLNPPQGGGKKS